MKAPDFLTFTAYAVPAFLAAVICVRLVLGWLRHRAYLDLPNERSSHSVPTPRGGGLVVTPVVVAGLLVAALLMPETNSISLALPIAALGLFILSWADDRRPLPATLRLAVQAVAVAAVLFLWPPDMLVFQGLLPPLADRVLAGLMWLWFVNLYNFMDGIDGITGIETAFIGLGLFLLTTAPAGALLIGAAAGFLVWNWRPARIFLGDSGSVPLGFMIGGLLLSMAAGGLWAAALILPAYYLSDATLTLIRRVAKGASPLQAHREHLYQKAVHNGGRTHSAVSLRIALANAFLVGCAVLSIHRPIAALIAAAVVVGTLFLVLTRR